jgi:hypothetical protein
VKLSSRARAAYSSACTSSRTRTKSFTSSPSATRNGPEDSAGARQLSVDLFAGIHSCPHERYWAYVQKELPSAAIVDEFLRWKSRKPRLHRPGRRHARPGDPGLRASRLSIPMTRASAASLQLDCERHEEMDPFRARCVREGCWTGFTEFPCATDFAAAFGYTRPSIASAKLALGQ